MIMSNLEKQLLDYTNESYSKNYNNQCIVHRREIRFTIYCNENVTEFLKEKFNPYANVETASFKTDTSFIKEFKVFLNCPFLEIAKNMNFNEVSIIKNEKDSRKNIQCSKLELDKFNIFIMGKSGNKIIYDKEINSFFISGSNLESQLEDAKVLIRDIINIGLINEGFVEVHASAVSNSKEEIKIICGNSNSGKTSILFDHLKNKYSLVSNGRVYIKLMKDSIFVLGTPESIYIRPITFRAFPEIQSILNGQKIETIKLYDENCQPDEKIKSHYKEVSEAFDCRIVTEGPLTEILFPQLSQPKKNVDLDEIIQNNIFGYDDICRREWAGALYINESIYNTNLENLKLELMNYDKKVLIFRDNDNYLYEKSD